MNPDDGQFFVPVCEVIRVESLAKNTGTPARLDTRRKAIYFPQGYQIPDKPISDVVAEAIRAYYKEQFLTKLTDR